jgi:nucleoside phosphorylase
LVSDKRPIAGRPERLIGPIATGDKVHASKDGLVRHLKNWPKLIGVEMEAGGAAHAAFHTAIRLGFYMVRGVSDLADSEKDRPDVQIWRSYACDVAASYALSLLASGPVPLKRQ